MRNPVTQPASAAITPETPIAKLPRLLSIKEVIDLTKISKANIYRRLDEIKRTGDISLFPVPVRSGKNQIGWHREEVAAWILSLPRVFSVPAKSGGPQPPAAHP